MQNDQPQPAGSDLNRRHFLAASAAVATAALAGSPASLLAQNAAPAAGPKAGATYPFELPKLDYAFNAMDPYIDAETMEIHHDKHHAAYVKNLNAALEPHKDLHALTLDQLLKDLTKVPEAIRTTVRNNGGGHANHSMFWATLKKNPEGKPSGPLAKQIDADFGSLDKFKAAFQEAGLKLFGSGWVFVATDPANGGKLKISPMPNQDSLLMAGLTPLFGNDVWEHAYYLKYQNRRADYLTAWWNVLDWDVVGQRFAKQASA